MESGSCAHEQQNRHLRSRVSQLEIMLEKERKRVSAPTQSTTTTQNWIPRQTPPVDVKKSSEYLALLVDLESERRVKSDLMANLKEMTTTNDSTRAQLIHELEDARTSRDALSSELDELQDEFDVVRGLYRSQICGSGSNTGPPVMDDQAAESAVDPLAYDDQDGKLTASSLKRFMSQFERAQDRRIRSTLMAITQSLPDDVLCDIDVKLADTCELEAGLVEAMSALKTQITSRDDLEGLRDFVHFCGGTEKCISVHGLSKLAVDSGVKRIQELQEQLKLLTATVYQIVPSSFSELFLLLNKNASFSYPKETQDYDESSEAAYKQYLSDTMNALSHTIRKYITSHAKSRQKISYRSFNAGDLALFLPTRNANSPAWAAFNVGAPHYFLDMDGVNTDGKDFLIGRILEVKEKAGEPGVDSDPQTQNQGEAEASRDERKWWEVKIVEKKKASQSAGNN